MKFVVFTISLVFFSLNGFSQNWQDTLRDARKLYQNSSYNESLKKYKSAQKHAPKNVDLSDEIGQTAYKAEQYEQAEKIYSQSSSKKGSPTQKAKTYHNIGNAKLKQKKYDEAIEAYKESLRNNPNDEETRYNLAEAMKKKKNQQDQQNQNKENKQDPKQNKQNQQQNQQNQQQNQNPQNQQNPPKQQGQQNQKSKLGDKKTDRMLDELTKKEMETKKKLDGNKGKSSGNKSGKDW